MPTGHPAILPATITPDVTVYSFAPQSRTTPVGSNEKCTAGLPAKAVGHSDDGGLTAPTYRMVGAETHGIESSAWTGGHAAGGTYDCKILGTGDRHPHGGARRLDRPRRLLHGQPRNLQRAGVSLHIQRAVAGRPWGRPSG